MHMAVPPFEREGVLALPSELQREVELMDKFREHQYAAHGTDYTPCLWLDPFTRKCKHHEHRPQVCRDFEVGNVHCITLRKDVGLG